MTSRRLWLGAAAASLATAGVAAGLVLRPRQRASKALVPDPDGVLDLPAGYRYRILERAGDVMSDGEPVRGHPDGMCCMVDASDPKRLILMRNHELPRPEGGVSRVVVDAHSFERLSSNQVLSGTDLNCAGGHFPGVGWVSCEESDVPGHGYAYLTRAAATRVEPGTRIPGYGRYRHEAVAIDPSSFTAYLTEDRMRSALYRFVPNDLHRPFEGRLEALAIEGHPQFDTTTARAGATWNVRWVPIDRPDQPGTGVFDEAFAKGAAIICRGEGITHHQGVFYFCATNGGPTRRGQVFALGPTPEGGTLRVLAASTDPGVLDMPDNITVAPWGELFVAEDDGLGENYVRGITRDGRVRDFAFNYASKREIAGVCFSPDGRALFLNLLAEGFTIAVFREDLGAWPEARRPRSRA